MKSVFFKKTRMAVVASALVLGGAAYGQIPVTDAVSITTQVANQVESITKWVSQFQQMQTQINQYRQQFESMTGSRGMGALLDNTALKAVLPADWQQVLSNIKRTQGYITERNKYPSFANLPKTNAMYDVIASQNAVMTDLYAKANERLGLIQSLTAKIDTATDPAAKADLTNRLISEQNAIQANQNLVTILQSKQKQELEIASQAAVKELSCKEFKRANC